MKTMRKFIAYLRSTLEPLAPLLRHAIKALYAAGIIGLTSLLLHYMLPHAQAEVVEQVELYFLLAVSAVLSLYTFILFCWKLFSHLWEELVIGIHETRINISQRLSELEESTEPTKQLPSTTGGDYSIDMNFREIEPDKVKGEQNDEGKTE